MNKLKLEYERKQKGISTEELCKAANMSRSAFYRKMNGKSQFTQGEIQAICDILALESPMDIFFDQKVS